MELIGNLPDDHSAFRTALAASIACGTVNASVARLIDTEAPGLDRGLALSNFSTYIRQDGADVPKWASLSGFYRTADDRFIQLHCNFPHHAAGAAVRLGVAEDRRAFEEAIARWDALDLEAALIADGMIVAAYRTMAEWNCHPHAAAVRGLPLLDFRSGGDGPSRTGRAGNQPLSGVRVLDCSRVLAGPAAGQTLANLGADVLRVGAEHLPSVEVCVMTTGTGKRNAFIDLRTTEGRATFAGLVTEADIVIDAFRPGAMDSYGFGPEALAQLSPGVTTVQICAFDWVGPWAGRRGFDSIVQSTTGIALAGSEYSGATEPVHLPVQSLDYCTGFLAAAAAIRGVAANRTRGGSWNAKLSLIRTRNWLVELGPPQSFEAAPLTPHPKHLATIVSDFGDLQMVLPFVGEWGHGPRRLGADDPLWRIQ